MHDYQVVWEYKKNASDEQWLSQSNGNRLYLFKSDTRLNLDEIGPSRAKDLDEITAKEISTCLKSVVDRVKIIDGGKNDKNNALKDEFLKLQELEETLFHWDTSIYDLHSDLREYEPRVHNHNDGDDEIKSDANDENDNEQTPLVVGSLRNKRDLSIGNFAVVYADTGIICKLNIFRRYW